MTFTRLFAAMCFALFALWLVTAIYRAAAGCAPC